MKLYLVDSATVNALHKQSYLVGEGTFDELLDKIKKDYGVIKSYGKWVHPDELETRQFVIVDEFDGRNFYEIAVLNFLCKK